MEQKYENEVIYRSYDAGADACPSHRMRQGRKTQLFGRMEQ